MLYQHDLLLPNLTHSLLGAEGWAHGFLGWPSGLAESCGNGAFFLCDQRDHILLSRASARFPSWVLWAEYSECSEVGWPNFCSKVLSSLTSPSCPSCNWIRSPCVLTLRSDFRGKGRRTSNLPAIGQNWEDGWLQGSQNKEHLEKEGRSEGRGPAARTLRLAGPPLYLKCVVVLAPSKYTFLRHSLFREDLACPGFSIIILGRLGYHRAFFLGPEPKCFWGPHSFLGSLSSSLPLCPLSSYRPSSSAHYCACKFTFQWHLLLRWNENLCEIALLTIKESLCPGSRRKAQQGDRKNGERKKKILLEVIAFGGKVISGLREWEV